MSLSSRQKLGEDLQWQWYMLWVKIGEHCLLSNPRVQYKWQIFACSILGASITPIRLAYVSLLRDAGLTAPLPVYVKGSRAIVAIVASIIFLITRFSLFLKNIFLAWNLSVYWLTIKPYQDTAPAETISRGICTCVLLYNMCCANVLHIHWINVARYHTISSHKMFNMGGV